MGYSLCHSKRSQALEIGSMMKHVNTCLITVSAFDHDSFHGLTAITTPNSYKQTI